jgi:hypothetical protein
MSASQEFEELLAEVGRSFRTVRERHGWTIAEVVEVSGLEEKVVVGIETGELDVGDTTLLRMLETYGFAALDPRSRHG